MDSRFKQAHKEAKWSLLLTIAWLIVWALSAAYAGNAPGLLGFPRWFEISCLFAPLLFLILCFMMVKYLFKDIPLEESHDEP